MPAAIATPPAPAAPAAPPAPAAPGPAQVPASTIPAPVEPAPKAKPGTAKARVFDELGKIAKEDLGGGTTAMPGPGGDRPGADATPTPPAATPPPGDKAPEATPAPAATPESGTPPPEPEKGKKPGPWKLLDEAKAGRLKAEQELAELRKLVPNEVEAKASAERLTRAEARVQELEKHIRYIDYQKSEEFQTKFQKPYEEAWQRATKELSEIPVVDPITRENRLATPQDLLDLVNLPLGQARAAAKEAFGDFADDVMGWRKSIRDIFDAQQQAIAEAKEQGGKWQKEQIEGAQKTQQALQKFVTEIWTHSNEEVKAHPEMGKWISPVEGDTEINSRLEKGFKLADEAFSVNPLDPKLTPEQRARAVRVHSALRNRAAAFGRVVYELRKVTAQLDEARKALDGYKRSEPSTTPSVPSQTTSGRGKAWDDMRAALAAKAK